MAEAVDVELMQLVRRYGRAARCPGAVDAAALEAHLNADEWTRLIDARDASLRAEVERGLQISTPRGRTLLLSAIFDGAGQPPVPLEPGMPWPRDGRLNGSLNFAAGGRTLLDRDRNLLSAMRIRW